MNYPGGKGGCYHHIINLIPPHRVYIETHLGGGNVLERLRPAQSTIGIDVDAAVIDLWKSLPEYQGPGYTFINGDAGSIIQRMELKGDELIYSDPPYLMSTRESGPLYNHEMSDEQHREWLEILLSVDCPAIISGYKSEMYMDMLAGWNYRTFQNTTRQGVVTEYAWFNYNLTAAKADYRYLGANFREREQIKRQRTRWVNNFNGLPPRSASPCMRHYKRPSLKVSMCPAISL